MVLSSKKVHKAKTKVLTKAESKDSVPLIIIKSTHLITETVHIVVRKVNVSSSKHWGYTVSLLLFL